MLDFFLIPSAIIILISFNAMYVAAEFATVASRKTRISQMANDGNRIAGLLLNIMDDSHQLDRYVAAAQIGITISSLLLGLYGQNRLTTILAEPLTASMGEGAEATAATIATITVLFLITTLQVILGELLPKSIAIQFPETIAMALIIPMQISILLLSPLIWVFNGSGRLILKALGKEHHEGHAHIHSPQEIEILVSESHEVGLLDDEERQMLRNAFRLRNLTAKQVMVHRTRILAAEKDTPVLELLQMATDAAKSRIPIYEETIDNIIGMVHIKDVFGLHVEKRQNISSILRPILHIPEALPASEVWDKLQNKNQYMGIIFDEFGGTAGLITLEDLIEEIFGELQDESDNETALTYIGEHGRRRLRADLLVSDVNEYLNLDLPEETDTLSGLVFSKLGRPPEEGDVIDLGNETFLRVEKMEDLGVAEVSIDHPSLDNISFSIKEWGIPDHE